MGERTPVSSMPQALRHGPWPVLLALLLSALHLASGGMLDQRLQDAAAAHARRAPLPELTLIAIDNESLARHGAWPWPRDVLAQLVDRLAAAGARTTVLALPLDGAQGERGLPYLRQIRTLLGSAPPDAQALAGAITRTVAEAEAALDTDQRLATSLRRAGNVLLMAHMEPAAPGAATGLHLPAFMHRSAAAGAAAGVPAARSLAAPLDMLGNAAAGVGHLGAPPGAGGPVREAPLLLAADGTLVPSLALLAAAHSLHLGASGLHWTAGQAVQIGSTAIATQPGGWLRPQPYAAGTELDGGTPGIAQVPAHTVLAGRVPAAQLQDRIAVVGPTASGTHAPLLRPGGASLAPVQWLAEQISAIRLGHVQTTPAWAPLLPWVLTLAALAVLLLALPALGAAAGSALAAALGLGLLAAQWGAMQAAGLALPLTLPAAVLLLGGATHALQRRSGRPAPAARAASDPEADRMMGLALQGQGQLDMAFARLRRVRGNPQVLSDLLHLAQEFENKLRYDQAVEVYTHILRQDREHAEARKRRRRARHLADIAAQASKPLDAAAPGAVLPAVLGRYQVEKELGRGAMGVVYQGRDPKIGRVVAIKTLALGQEFEGSALLDARTRFFREAESAGRLQHQHIVTIYDAGEDLGLAWIAMELLKGQDLAHATAPGQLLPVEQVLSIAARVADALDYAHQQNVVHRDIKPANIMYDAQTDTVKVTDFGIARITDSSKTRTGMVLGTPSFMAPEQLAGRRVDGRCDLYALGVTLFQLLTGQLPLRGHSMSELMQHIAHTPAPDVRSLRPELPAALAQVVAQALRKDPRERHQTGRQFAAALRGVYATPGAAQAPAAMPADHGLDYDDMRSQSSNHQMPDLQTTVMGAAPPQAPASGPGPGVP